MFPGGAVDNLKHSDNIPASLYKKSKGKYKV